MRRSPSPIGLITAEAQHLLRVTENALALGISLATPGRRLNQIGAAIQMYVEDEGCSVVRGLAGHGIGQQMWEEPSVPNYRQPERGPLLKPGMVFTIEPMINLGRRGTPHTARQMDDRHQGSLAFGPFRAHHRGH